MENIKQNQPEGRKIPKKKRKRMEKELARLTKRRDALQREHDRLIFASTTLFRTKDQKISIVGKSKLLDFPTMPTTAESLPLLISFCIH